MSDYPDLSLFEEEDNDIMAVHLQTGTNGTDNYTINETSKYYGEMELTPEEKLFMTSMAYRFKVVMSDSHNVISVIMGLLAIISNILSLLALTQVKSSNGSYFKLLMSLSSSDILIGFSLVMHKSSKFLNLPYRAGVGPSGPRLRSRCIYMVIRALSNTALNSNVLNLMAMALDHYIAILKPLHYHIYVNDRRRHVLIGTLWLVAVLLGFSDFFSGFHARNMLPSNLNYCEVIWITLYQEEFCTFALSIICLCIMMYIYIRIYIEVRKQQERELQPRDLVKNKKALITTLLILGSFILCWLPLCLFQVAMVIQVNINTTKVHSIFGIYYNADKYLTDLLCLNAICDPIIYAFRMREVRQGYARLFYHCFKRFYKHPIRRRQSETITLDYTLSFREHRKSSCGLSNGSIPRKTEKSNSTHSMQSFPISATVIEGKRQSKPSTSSSLSNGSCCQHPVTTTTTPNPTQEIVPKEHNENTNSTVALENHPEHIIDNTEDKCLLLNNDVKNNTNNVTKSVAQSPSARKTVTEKNRVLNNNNIGNGVTINKSNNNIIKQNGYNKEECEQLVKSDKSEFAQTDKG